MKKNKKGFTLIELLAVIVILGILLAIAIPAVAKYINNARKSTYIANVQSYAQAAMKEALAVDGKYLPPVNTNEATVISFGVLQDSLENGGKTSPYGADWNKDNSYVIVVNSKTAEEPKYTYYIAAIDEKGYGIGENKAATAKVYTELKESHILQLGNNGISYSEVAGDLDICITSVYTESESKTGQKIGSCD